MSLSVASLSPRTPHTPSPPSIPAHWADSNHSHFINPWPSWRSHHFSDRLKLLRAAISGFPRAPENILDLIRVRTPTWGVNPTQTQQNTLYKPSEQIKATWLGHACFLVELPSREATDTNHRGVRILFDPIFSDRCFAVQWAGPKRYTPAPCKIEDIPEVDVIVISHNHYDHMDTHTLSTLFGLSHQHKPKSARMPHIFVPLGNAPYLHSLGIPTTHTHVMDWWDSKRVQVQFQPYTDAETRDGHQNAERTSTIDITCTPAQHFTGRGVLDHFKTLWASWVVEEVLQDPIQTARPPTKIYFAGDTGYRAVLDGQDEDSVPTCPAFKTIGQVFGGFDFAMIPIGAYLPREFMSPIHCAPQDSVRLFQDVKAKKALGMHWATWVLTSEDILEPPKKLKEECKKLGIQDEDFNVCDIGETVFF